MGHELQIAQQEMEAAWVFPSQPEKSGGEFVQIKGKKTNYYLVGDSEQSEVTSSDDLAWTST